MIYSVYLLSVFPRQHVIYTETERAAQVTARLLAERHPGLTFGYQDGPDFRHDDCPPSIRNSALSSEVQQLVAAAMVLEAAANPKQCVFKSCNGGVVMPFHVVSETVRNISAGLRCGAGAGDLHGGIVGLMVLQTPSSAPGC